MGFYYNVRLAGIEMSFHKIPFSHFLLCVVSSIKINGIVSMERIMHLDSEKVFIDYDGFGTLNAVQSVKYY